MLFGYQKILDFIGFGAGSVEVADEHCKIFAKLGKIETVAFFFVLCERAQIFKLVAIGKLKNAGFRTCDGLRKT